MYKLTKQQQLILDTIETTTNKIVMVKARAGTGKTAISLSVVDHLKPKKALYTAFNKAIVLEGQEKFTSNVECKTIHALALSYVRPKLPIEDFTYLCIKEPLSYVNKASIINAMDEFYRSSSLDMYTYLESLLQESPKLVPITIKYIEGMINDTVNPTFNFLLKYFHILMHEKQITVNYDLVILDEIQDSTGVAIAIFQLINSPRKLGLGDPDQSIYGFMKLVNGFEVLTDTINLELSKSFRCSTSIAKRIQKFGKEHLSDDFKFVGTDTPIEDNLTAYITSTNAQIVMRINALHKEGKGYMLTRPIKDIFACSLALTTAQMGKQVYHKRYKFLEQEYQNYTLSGFKSFYSYLLKEVKDDEIRATIEVLSKFRKNQINIFDVLKEAKSTKSSRTITVGTGFSLKGLEFSTVYIENDLNSTISKIISDGGPETEEEHTMFKLYYVAVSRCRKHLYNAQHLK